MSKPNQLRYHQEVFNFLNSKPTISSSALQVIEKRETACGITFPLAVKEWYSIEGAIKLFEENTEHYLTPLEELGNSEEIFHGYLTVAVENQGVVVWSVRLDGSDDPPVIDIPYGDEDLSKVDWDFISEKFSTFIFNMICADNVFS